MQPPTTPPPSGSDGGDRPPAGWPGQQPYHPAQGYPVPSYPAQGYPGQGYPPPGNQPAGWAAPGHPSQPAGRGRSGSSLVAAGSALLAAAACLVSLLLTFWHYRSGTSQDKFDFDINAFGTYTATSGHNPFVGHDTRYGIELAVLGGLLLIAALWTLVSNFAPYVVMTAAAAGTVAIAAEVLLDLLSRRSYNAKDFSQSAGPGVYLVFVAGVLALITTVLSATQLSARRTAG